MDCGASLLIPAPGLGNTHLWIVATAPDPRCILVSLTTLRFDRDQTVVLHPGDHPFVRHQTVALYGDARVVSIEALQAQVRAGTAKPHLPCSNGMVKLIQAGILASPHTPRKVETFYREWLGKQSRGAG